MENEDYKLHEDNQQVSLLNEAIEDGNGFYCYTTLTSCKHLSRRFIHSANAYFYQCHSDVEMDGCPKTENQGIADAACFSSPFAFVMGEDNNDEEDSNGRVER
jgi:hypothetical protein